MTNKKNSLLSDDCYQLVFNKESVYITPHLYQYKNGFWKVFQGRKRIGTFDKTLNTKIRD